MFENRIENRCDTPLRRSADRAPSTVVTATDLHAADGGVLFRAFMPQPGVMEMTESRRVGGSLLRVDRLPSGQRRLVRDLEFDLGDDVDIPAGRYRGFDVVGGSTRVLVPHCFVTDFSSIPPFARPFYRFSSVDLAGVCHDWAYRMGVDRKQADRCWRIVATSGEARIGSTAGRLGYMALRLFGWWAYRGNRRKRLGGIIVDSQVGTPCTCQPCGDETIPHASVDRTS